MTRLAVENDRESARIFEWTALERKRYASGMELSRKQLFDQIWAEPIGKVADRYGLTGNGLAKICDRLNIPRPPRSHWTRNPDTRATQPPLPAPPLGLSEGVAIGKRGTRLPPGQRTRMGPVQRREQLMKLAERIVLSEGLKALTLRRLAKEIGISETQVNNSMGSRTDLLCSMARREIAAIETRRQKRVSRSSDHRLRVALSTIGYLHEAAARGPLLKILLRVPEVKSALREERIEAATSARAPILRKLTSGGGMDWQTAKASTAALTAVSLKAGGIVAARRAPFPMVEQICLTIIMAGVASDDELASRNQS